MEDIQRERLAQSLHHAHESRNNSYTIIDYIRGLEQRIEKLERDRDHILRKFEDRTNSMQVIGQTINREGPYREPMDRYKNLPSQNNK